MISLSGLLTLGVSLFTSMAVGTIAVVLVSVVGSLTFLPATLAILGDRVNLGRPSTWLPRLATALPLDAVRDRGRAALDWLDRRAIRQEGSGFWGSLVTAVMSRPIRLMVLSAAILLALGSPVLHLRTGITDISAFPDSIDGIAGIKLLDEKWPQGTELQLAGRGHQRRQARDPGRDRAAQDRGPEAGRAERAGRGHAVTRRQGRDRLVHDGRRPERRGEPQPRPAGPERARPVGLRRRWPTSGRYVTGNAAFSVDVTQVYADGIPTIFAFVLGLSFLLMLIAFHSIVIPIKAILLNLLSTGAAYGVLVAVFQDGWLATPLGITPSGVIESWVPLFIFTILFGLSMDYHLFILTRIKEARDRGLESRDGGRAAGSRSPRGRSPARRRSWSWSSPSS